MIPDLRAMFYSFDEKLDLPWKIRIVKGLKKLFCQLEFLDSQNQLTEFMNEVFGWNQSEMLNQHDIQEAIRIIFGYVEDAFKGTSVAEKFTKLLKGTNINFIKCSECKTESIREEHFYDLFLNVRAKNESLNADLLTALKESFEVELLQNTNQYFCGVCNKKQNATKGMRIKQLPEYVCFYINRFEFDPNTYERKKIKSTFDFPFKLDLSPFTEEISSNEYEYFAGIIHRGTAYSGHYHVVIRDLDLETKNKSPQPCFNDFNDTIVNPVNEEYLDRFKKSGDENCYLLIYRKKGEFSSVLPQPIEDEITKEIKIENDLIKTSREEYENLKHKIRVYVGELSSLLESGAISIDNLQTIEGDIEDKQTPTVILDKRFPSEFVKNLEQIFKIDMKSHKLYLVRIKNDKTVYYVDEFDVLNPNFDKKDCVCMNSMLFIVNECFFDFPLFKNFKPKNVF